MALALAVVLLGLPGNTTPAGATTTSPPRQESPAAAPLEERRLHVIAPNVSIHPTFRGMSRDGSRIVLSTLNDLDTNQGSRPDIVANVAGRFLPFGAGSSSYKGHTPDGRFVVVSTGAAYVPEDTDGSPDFYLFSATGPRLVTLGTTGPYMQFEFVAHDASAVVFESREALTAEDTDTSDDLYQWDAATGSVRLLTLGIANAEFVSATPDAGHVLFRTSFQGDLRERVGDTVVVRATGSARPFWSDASDLYFSTASSLDPADTDGAGDIYRSDASGYHLLTAWTGHSMDVVGLDPTGQRMLVSTTDQMTPVDTDATKDLYLVEGETAVLVSKGVLDVEPAGASSDLGTVVYKTWSQIAEGDPVDTNDLYLWSEANPAAAELLTRGNGGDNVAAVHVVSDDGTRIVFETSDPVLPEEVGSGYSDIYEWVDGIIRNVTPGTSEGVKYLGASADGRRIVFQSNENLVPDDLLAGGTFVSDADLVPPVATATRVSPDWGSSATFELGTGASDGVWFECRLDGGDLEPCEADHTVTGLGAGTHQLDVVAFDAAGNASAPVTVSWLAKVDTVAPTSTAPTRTFISGSSISAGRITVRLAWSGADATSGIARYELAQSTDGGPWTTVAGTLTTASRDQPLLTGRTYRFRVRPVDKAGNVGLWAPGVSFTLSRYIESSSRIAYTGTWRSASSSVYWGGIAKYASTAGAKATFTSTGRLFAWIARKGPTRGKAEIFVNGTRVATVDLYASSYQNQRVAWSTTWSTAATRTVAIRVVGTSGRPRVDLDAIVTTN